MLDAVFDSLRDAQKKLALESGENKNKALLAVAEAIRKDETKILLANTYDIEKARQTDTKESLVERLRINEDRVHEMIQGVKNIANLPDPVGKVRAGWTLPNGLFIESLTVPLGVVAIIYESRPNVTVDAFALAYKAGCSILLRGSSAALNSNQALVTAIKYGLKAGGGIEDAVELASSGEHSEVNEILQARGKIDVVLPRGGHNLIQYVLANARVPVIETGEGNCHIYIEPSADPQNAAEIICNAKTQRPGACNAVETILVHRDALSALAPLLTEKLAGKVKLRCDPQAKAAFGETSAAAQALLLIEDATEEDWETEYLDFILAVKTVDTIDQAIDHIKRYGTGHSECILTDDLKSSERFLREVDAACVYVNASTRFTDGGAFGFGAELGISTQKLHVRGPMGLEALCSIKYLIRGSGQIRP
ncbi:MAG: glutamate-5-semialdehyde dehydrogenase [Spirochaetaceae bacterium]|jgi:glutamate-5-semialdehyde dehydrogenase|nr:glutamate-5-semialdehyde dehydrogenase [Spirochaetaceae bacterium]